MSAGSLRWLADADAPAFLLLRQRMLRDHPDAYHSTAEEWDVGWDVGVKRALERIRRNRVVGAFVDGALVGCVVLALEARPGTKRRHKVEVWGVYLAPEHRGSGLARGMMEAAIAEARRLGYDAVMLGVTTHNPARRLYEQLGFVAYGIEPRAVRLPSGEAFDDCLMQLDLRPA